jgi:hypothetical protein
VKPLAWIFAGVLTIWVPVSLSFYMRRIVFTSVLLPCGVYECIPSRTIISDSDEADPSSRVYAVSYVWAPTAVSYLVRQ